MSKELLDKLLIIRAPELDREGCEAYFDDEYIYYAKGAILYAKVNRRARIKP